MECARRSLMVTTSILDHNNPLKQGAYYYADNNQPSSQISANSKSLRGALWYASAMTLLGGGSRSGENGDSFTHFQ